MPSFDLQLLLADGTPAAGALVSIASAPASLPDLGRVADAQGRVCIEGPPGSYRFSIWLDGRERQMHFELTQQQGVHLLRLPV